VIVGAQFESASLDDNDNDNYDDNDDDNKNNNNFQDVKIVPV